MLVLAYLGLSLLVGVVGRTRPLGFWVYLISSLLFTPLFGLILLAAAGRNRVDRRVGHGDCDCC